MLLLEFNFSFRMLVSRAELFINSTGDIFPLVWNTTVGFLNQFNYECINMKCQG